jgi:ATP synthase F1 gamma subunit
MRRPQDIADEETSMATIVMLTNAFEGLASMRIAQVKGQVMQSQRFFSELWSVYRQIRVDSLFRYGRHQSAQVSDKSLIIAVTAEGGFSGDIDQRLISAMMEKYKPAKHDIIVIGHHGALQLAQAGVDYKKYFKLPEKDFNLNVAPLIAEVAKYKAVYVYYQRYTSLMVQDIELIELSKAIQEMGNGIDDKGGIITEKNYIFEPDAFAVVAHMERSMLEITLGQVILDSKLAQYASRFRAMRVAYDRSSESLRDLHTSFNRAKRMQSDERLKEIINGLKKTKVAA